LTPQKSHWHLPESITVPEALYEVVGNNSFLAELLFRRGITDPAAARSFLDPKLYKPASPGELPDLEKAVELITSFIQNHSLIGVWGDFDVDGQTATTILVSVVRCLGGSVVYHIPVRGRESHGVSLPYLKEFLAHGVKLLITCDTGINASEAVDFAHSVSVPVIITDHHLLPEVLPRADAIVNPRLLIEKHPLASLSGAGVAFKLAEALMDRFSIHEKNLPLGDLVALGLIADQVQLKGDARYLVQQGIKELQKSARLAILEMLTLLEIQQGNISEEHIGFYLAPRLNALGRLADANLAVEFLQSTNPKYVHDFAHNLEILNQKRKLLSDQVFQAAHTQISASRELQDESVIILDHPSWPEGVLGIVASQLVETYNRPIILLTSGETGILKGSARSIEGIDITRAIASHKAHLLSYGGHPMAAGLSLKANNLVSFQKGINRFIQDQYRHQVFNKILDIDYFLQISDIKYSLADQIEKLAPFGVGNPNPVMVARSLVVNSSQTIGKTSEHRSVVVEDQTAYKQKIVWWKGAEQPLPEGLFDLAFSIRSTNYQGQMSLQVEWIDAHPAERQPATLPSHLKFQVEDYRNNPEFMGIINRLIREGKSEVIWEGRKNPEIQSSSQGSKVKRDNLILATIPPNRQKMMDSIHLFDPRKVFLFGINPYPPDQTHRFLEYCAGLLKFGIRQKMGEMEISGLERLTGQSQSTILAGLEWFSAHGDIQFLILPGGKIKLASPGQMDSLKLEIMEKKLTSLLNETRAFRSYYLRTEIENLFMDNE
jgi:single-stranded-DNA-specific exonuclease